jgi:undecaprenyl-diphosphatase
MKHPIMLTAIVFCMLFLTYFTVNYDAEISGAISGLRNPVLDAFMVLITNIATLYIGVPVIVIAVYLKNKRAARDLVLALVIGVLLSLLLKSMIARPRPEILDLGFLVSAMFYSFPSDHASTAFIMFGVMGHYFKKFKKAFYLLAVLIAFSRIYLGAHYATDVVAGAFLGILVSQAVMRYKLGNRIARLFKKF